jgi:hypothetical protein
MYFSTVYRVFIWMMHIFEIPTSIVSVQDPTFEFNRDFVYSIYGFHFIHILDI